ncbi:MAG: thioredoxin family protein [Bacteroidetes bacterium]|nr:thioredoxin family protein [Bacteroidota bacterium]
MNTTVSSIVIFVCLFLTASGVSIANSQEWEENAQFGVEIAGALDLSAQVFQPTNYQPFMILTSEKLAAPVLLDLSKKRVYMLKSSTLKKDGGFLKTSGVPKGSDAGTYAVKGGVTTFKVKGKTVSMVIRQTLVGEVAREIILAHSPDYEMRMKAYKPKQKAIAFLKSYKKKTEVIVMFATWCSTCKIVLPSVLRTFGDGANPQISVRYIGIAMGGSEPAEELERYGHDYPAVIVYQNGKEIDRIIGDPPGAMEDAIVNILK